MLQLIIMQFSWPLWIVFHKKICLYKLIFRKGPIKDWWIYRMVDVGIDLKRLKSPAPTLNAVFQVPSTRFKSFNPLSILCLMQPRRLLAFLLARAHCWRVFNLVSTRTPKAFSAEMLVSPLMCPGAWGCFSPGTGFCASYWTPSVSCQTISPACPCPSGWHHSPFVYWTFLLVLYHMQTCTLPNHPGQLWRC